MDFNAERYAKIIDHAVGVKQDIFDQIETILGKDVTEDDVVVFFSALSVMSKLTSQLARVVSTLPPEKIKQIIREDCVREKIIFNELFPNVLPAVAKEIGSEELGKFLIDNEFFGYPDEKIARWDVSLNPGLDVAQ